MHVAFRGIQVKASKRPATYRPWQPVETLPVFDGRHTRQTIPSHRSGTAGAPYDRRYHRAGGLLSPTVQNISLYRCSGGLTSP
uniref:Uncharacterized protein n=1 Tax=Anguilla anguilla TaxID=7936 RepID=A0A0E9X9S8_ANGAN